MHARISTAMCSTRDRRACSTRDRRACCTRDRRACSTVTSGRRCTIAATLLTRDAFSRGAATEYNQARPDGPHRRRVRARARLRGGMRAGARAATRWDGLIPFERKCAGGPELGRSEREDVRAWVGTRHRGVGPHDSARIDGAEWRVRWRPWTCPHDFGTLVFL
eukprot:6214078-Pleurochrysis_carterae.AAC.1